MLSCRKKLRFWCLFFLFSLFLTYSLSQCFSAVDITNLYLIFGKHLCVNSLGQDHHLKIDINNEIINKTKNKKKLWLSHITCEWYIFDVCRYKLAVPCLNVFKATLDISQIGPVSLSRFNHKTDTFSITHPSSTAILIHSDLLTRSIYSTVG